MAPSLSSFHNNNSKHFCIRLSSFCYPYLRLTFSLPTEPTQGGAGSTQAKAQPTLDIGCQAGLELDGALCLSCPPPPCPFVVLRRLSFAPGGGRAELVPAGARPCRPVRVRGCRTSREWPSTAVGLAGRPSRTRSRRVVEVGCWPGRGRLSAVPSLSAQHSPVCTVRVTGDTVLPRPEVGRGQG